MTHNSKRKRDEKSAHISPSAFPELRFWLPLLLCDSCRLLVVMVCGSPPPPLPSRQTEVQSEIASTTVNVSFHNRQKIHHYTNIHYVEGSSYKET